jgi:hypothetical protein
MNDAVWIAAMTGGLAGAALNHLLGLVYWLISRPYLRVDFKEQTDGCRAEVNDRTFFRTKIGNSGWTNAKNVKVLISNVTSNRGELYDAYWSGSKSEKMDIPSNTFRFCDIFVLSDEIGLNIHSQSDVKLATFGRPGLVSADVHVTSDNACTVTKRILLNLGSNSASTTIA